MLDINTKAPEFKLPDQDGKMHTLSEYKGQKVILYFYPQACLVHPDVLSFG